MTTPAPPRSTSADSRSSLLQAASEEFLQVGFHAARVQRITARAGVGLAAINYHFGGKAGLYLAVLEQHAALAIEHAPLPVDDQLPLRDQLAGLVEAILHRMVDPASPSRIGPLMLREMMNPTPALDQMFTRVGAIQAGQAITVLRRIAGPALTDEQLRLCLFSLFGQCIFYLSCQPMVQRLSGVWQADAATLQQLATHITRFTWGGLQAIQPPTEEPCA